MGIFAKTEPVTVWAYATHRLIIIYLWFNGTVYVCICTVVSAGPGQVQAYVNKAISSSPALTGSVFTRRIRLFVTLVGFLFLRRCLRHCNGQHWVKMVTVLDRLSQDDHCIGQTESRWSLYWTDWVQMITVWDRLSQDKHWIRQHWVKMTTELDRLAQDKHCIGQHQV